MADFTPISAPGIYDVSEDLYHSVEICDGPSISSSGLRLIDSECPAKYWWASPLNAEYEPVRKKSFTFGKAAHQWLMLGPETIERRFLVIDDGLNLNSNEGKEVKAQAISEGREILRAADLVTIERMANALRAHPYIPAAFADCEPEKTLVWKDAETGVWLRCRPDALPSRIQHIPDYKTAVSAKPLAFQRAIWNYGYHQQAQFYLAGIEAVTDVKPKSFLFIAQEKTPPYVAQPYVLDENAIDWARLQNRRAIHTFARCLERDEWPGYADDIIQIDLPAWADNQLMRRDAEGDLTVPEPTADPHELLRAP